MKTSGTLNNSPFLLKVFFYTRLEREQQLTTVYIPVYIEHEYECLQTKIEEDDYITVKMFVEQNGMGKRLGFVKDTRHTTLIGNKVK